MWKQLLLTAGVGVFVLNGSASASASQLTPQELVKTTKSLHKTERHVLASKQAVEQEKRNVQTFDKRVEAIEAKLDHVSTQLESYETTSTPADQSIFKQVLSSVLPSAKAEEAEKADTDLKAKEEAAEAFEQLSGQQAAMKAERDQAKTAHTAAYKELNAQTSRLKDLKKQVAAITPDQFMIPATGRLSQGFGPASGRFGYTFHNGIDIAAEVGTPIYAAADGKVTEINASGPYGKHVFIEHNLNGQKWTTVYAHMHKIEVKKEQELLQGEGIGQIGNTGNSSGPHLHFEVHQGKYNYSSSSAGNAVDPMDVAEVLGGASPIKATY